MVTIIKNLKKKIFITFFITILISCISPSSVSLINCVLKKDVKKVRGEVKGIKDINLQDPEAKKAALHYSAGMGNVEITKILLKSGADVNLKGEIGGRTPLFESLFRPRDYKPADYNEKIVDLLLKFGAKVNLKAINGQTPLMWAAAFSSVRIVKLLIEKGADVNYGVKKEEWGKGCHNPPAIIWVTSNLKYTKSKRNYAVRKILLDAGAKEIDYYDLCDK